MNENENNEVGKVIEELREEEEEQQKQRQVKPAGGVFNISSGKAKAILDEADNSKLAELLNHLIYEVYPCKNRQLTEEDVKEVNVGGAVVASIQVFLPNLPLNHPVIVLLVRIITLYFKAKIICRRVHDRIEELKNKVHTVGGKGIKPEYDKNENQAG